MNTSTITDPATAALPVPAAPATAIEVAVGSNADGTFGIATCVGARVICASTSIAPAASALPAMNAVEFTFSTATSIDTPTELPSENAPAAATVWMLRLLIACTVSAPLDFRFEPLAAEAVLLSVLMMLTATDPAIPASPVPPPAAAAHTMKLSVVPAGVTAAMVMPLPVTVEPLFTVALLVLFTTSTATAAPISVLPLCIEIAEPTAWVLLLAPACALIVTAPVAIRLAPLVSSATLFMVSTPTATEAATPTLPELPPPWLPLSLLAFEVWPLADGSEAPLAPLVLLLPLTCLSACPSAPDLPLLLACESLADSPIALAVASVWSVIVSVALSVAEPAVVVMLRATCAVTFSADITLTDTDAPTATLLPATLASVVVSNTPGQRGGDGDVAGRRDSTPGADIGSDGVADHRDRRADADLVLAARGAVLGMRQAGVAGGGGDR